MNKIVFILFLSIALPISLVNASENFKDPCGQEGLRGSIWDIYIPIDKENSVEKIVQAYSVTTGGYMKLQRTFVNKKANEVFMNLAFNTVEFNYLKDYMKKDQRDDYQAKIIENILGRLASEHNARISCTQPARVLVSE